MHENNRCTGLASANRLPDPELLHRKSFLLFKPAAGQEIDTIITC